MITFRGCAAVPGVMVGVVPGSPHAATAAPRTATSATVISRRRSGDRDSTPGAASHGGEPGWRADRRGGRAGSSATEIVTAPAVYGPAAAARATIPEAGPAQGSGGPRRSPAASAGRIVQPG